MWRIEDLELVPVDSKWLGHFFGGDCYLLLYTYLIGEKQHYLLYVWQVRPHPIPRGVPLAQPTPLHAPAITHKMNTLGDEGLTPFGGGLFYPRALWLSDHSHKVPSFGFSLSLCQIPSPALLGVSVSDAEE